MNIRNLKVRQLLGIALIAVAAPASAQIGVSVHIGEPGYYGRIDIGDYPRPRLIYAEPLIIERVRIREPIYLHVPPGHAKDWRKHCKHYDACARPVYFVDDRWYQDEYVPRYRERHGKGGHDHDDRHDHDDHGPGKGKGNNGKGHGKGHKD